MSTRQLKEKSRLGRGITAIFGDGSTAAPGDVQSGETAALPATQIEGYFLCDMSLIDPMPRQPRQKFNEEALAELAESIRIHGLLQPLVVRVASNGRYALIAGERRYRASLKLGLTRVPVVVRDADAAGELELALIENLLREDLDPIEEAISFKRLLEEHNHTHQMLADRLQRSRTAITNSLRLLQLSQKVIDSLQRGDISVGHARTLITLDDEAQAVLAQRAITESLSVRQLETLANRVSAGEDPARVQLVVAPPPAPEPEPEPEAVATPPRPARTPPRPLRPQLAAVQRKLQEHLATRVRIEERKGGGGSIEIEYADNAGLQAILDNILPDR